MCTTHVLMRFCHLVDHLFVCKVKEGRHIRISVITCYKQVTVVNTPKELCFSLLLANLCLWCMYQV